MLLETVEHLRVVDEAGSGSELLEKVQRRQPDFVVTGIAMSGMSGLGMLEALRALPDPPKVLVVSMHDTPELMQRAVRLGAGGFIARESSPTEFDRAVRCVMDGLPYLGARAPRRDARSAAAPPHELLTARQLEIVELLASGYASKEIGFRLDLSTGRVNMHLEQILDRLGLDDVACLTLYAVRHGLVDPSVPS